MEKQAKKGKVISIKERLRERKEKLRERQVAAVIEGFRELAELARNSPPDDLRLWIKRNGTITDFYVPSEDYLFTLPSNPVGKNIREVLPESTAALWMRYIKGGSGVGRSFQYELQMNRQLRRYDAEVLSCGDGAVIIIAEEIAREEIKPRLVQR